MNVAQRLFLAQARSDWIVFNLLRDKAELPHCHALHYLQMATEMLGKADAWRNEAPGGSHRSLVAFLRRLTSNREAQASLGYRGQNNHWQQMLRKSVAYAERIEQLAPAIALDNPNPEYPWPRGAPTAAPAEFSFNIWRSLQDSSDGRKFLKLVGQLMEIGDQYL